MWDFSFFLNSMLLGVGLAMDAFCVSVANGLNEPDMKFRRMSAMSLVFAAFQAVMPLTGWFFVHTLVTYFTVFEYFVPWIALLLLGIIGGKMIYSGLKKKTDEKPVTSAGALFIQGVATSIDALSVGFTIANYDFINALVEALIIAAVTFGITLTGVKIGKKFGTALSEKATLAGGIILVAIGAEIFIKGMIELYA